jgi:hypothetical protein
MEGRTMRKLTKAQTEVLLDVRSKGDCYRKRTGATLKALERRGLIEECPNMMAAWVLTEGGRGELATGCACDEDACAHILALRRAA